MKKLLYLSSIVALLASCLTEKNADPGKPSTFVRYFNGGNNDFAKLAEETSDKGIIILGTTEITNEDLTKRYNIKLVKTDEYGNVIWQNLYPADFAVTAENISGQGLLQLTTGGTTSGFLVIGKKIISPERSEMHLIQVSDNGELVNQKTIDFSSIILPGSAIQGQAIQLNNNGNYLVLGVFQAVPDPVTGKIDENNMVLAELDKADLSIKWVKKYGAGKASLSNKIYLDGSNNVVWSGTVTRNASSDIRLVKTAQNSLNTIFDLQIGSPNFQETGNDICRYGNGFAVVGATNEKTGVDDDILLKFLADDGSEVKSVSFGFGDTDIGNSVISGRGGVVVLGTSKAIPEDLGGRGEEDYYLAKYDAFGNALWSAPKIFGSKNKDTGASVRQLSDGSLLILGTTEFGGVNRNTMMLMKADSEGNIE